ncbi:MAG TPA: formylmethanofuran dehydrogenase subunit E family protein [Candidatus Omnitrophota bacterium]|nr:formylmethanofuran dehydrogenase subunit E family protein [Candidatus Omnitrophota bacterium]
MKNLKNAVNFHGHLGPYLALGLLMGDLALRHLKCEKHFGIKALVKGADKKPKSCLIDGIQVSSGCTYGKGNIEKRRGSRIAVSFRSLQNNKKIGVSLKRDLIKALDNLDGHRHSEIFARELLKINPKQLFELKF